MTGFVAQCCENVCAVLCGYGATVETAPEYELELSALLRVIVIPAGITYDVKRSSVLTRAKVQVVFLTRDAAAGEAALTAATAAFIRRTFPGTGSVTAVEVKLPEPGRLRDKRLCQGVIDLTITVEEPC